jgi:hypothetical protein
VITLDDIRRMATAFPEVEEFTHFRIRMPAFKVMGKAFAGSGARVPRRASSAYGST